MQYVLVTFFVDLLDKVKELKELKKSKANLYIS